MCSRNEAGDDPNHSAKMIKEIVLYGDAVLRTKCGRVEELTEEIRVLAKDMLETMVSANGIGLAAPQVGVPIQLAVVDLSHDEECVSYLRVNGEDRPLSELMPLVFVNPELEFGKEVEVLEEGCLSFPDVRGDVKRPVALKAKLQTLEGETIEVETDGLLSRVIQHETDHLNGVLFIDRMSPVQKLGLKKKIKEMRESCSS